MGPPDSIYLSFPRNDGATLLTGKKIVLRAFERDDLTWLHKWQNDEEVMRLARSAPDHTISMVAVEAKYDKILKGEDFAERGYIVEEKDTKRALGWASISIHQWNRRATSADIGLAIGEKDFWQRGIGTETVDLLLKETFEQLNLHRVGWWTFAGNTASIALAKKMGLKEEGRVRDSVFFDNKYHDSVVLGILKSEYEELRRKHGHSSPNS